MPITRATRNDARAGRIAETARDNGAIKADAVRADLEASNQAEADLVVVARGKGPAVIGAVMTAGAAAVISVGLAGTSSARQLPRSPSRK